MSRIDSRYSDKGQSLAKAPVEREGILMPESPDIRTTPLFCNSLEEASLVLRTVSEKLLELKSVREKELCSQLQELLAKREEKKKEAQNLALRYNEVVIQHNIHMDRAKFLQNENDKLAKVFLCTTFIFRSCFPFVL